MSARRHRLCAALAAGGGLLLAGAGLLLDAPRGAVEWGAARVVVIESDDWGLCGFFPAAAPTAAARAHLGGGFPPPYWDSTLEDSADVAALAGLLARHAGRDGLPPVLQANMIVSALEPPGAERPADVAWRRIDLPDLPRGYARPGLVAAVDAAIGAGVWRPELHGAFHYDPARREAALATHPGLRPLLEETVLCPGSDTAWELGCWRATGELRGELARSVAVFTARFGHRPVSVCAPDYVWDPRCERLWAEQGLTVIQAKREQLDSRRPRGGMVARGRKALARAWDRWRHPERSYLDRNCRFEPAQAPDSAAALAGCLAAIRQAWARGEPAIVETHRVNFVSLAPGAAAAGRRQLDRLLAALAADPGGRPLYLTDAELAQLGRDGTSCAWRGGSLVVRNLTRGARVVATPEGAGAAPRLLVVPPGATLLQEPGRPHFRPARR